MDTTSDKQSSAALSGQETVLSSKRVIGALTLVLILLAAFLFAATVKSLKEYGYVGHDVINNTIAVSGEGEIFAEPDTAEFTFSIEEEADTVSAVKDAASVRADAVIEALRAGGVEEKDIKTTRYELHPKYVWEPATCLRYPCDRTQVQQGFTLSQAVRVKVRNLDQAGELLESVANTDVSSVSGLTFTLADEDAKRAEARRLAIDDAQAKAQELAGDLGVTLVRIVNFNENNFYPMPYAAMRSDMPLGLGGDMEEAAGAVPLPAGENRITSNVTIVYEIR